jgi:hypothetical protein
LRDFNPEDHVQKETEEAAAEWTFNLFWTFNNNL